MRRHSESACCSQLPLAFNPVQGAEIPALLHTAYSRLALARRISFEQAMRDPAYAIGIRNMAEALARRGPQNHSARRSREPGSDRR